MIGIEQITEIANTTPKHCRNSGISCRFIRINQHIGIKLYKSEPMRDKTYNMQKKASKIGRAPNIYDKFDIIAPFNDIEDEPSTLYGYVTECIDNTYGDQRAQDFGYTNYNSMIDYYCGRDLDTVIEDEFYSAKEYDDMTTELFRIGISSDDIHSCNAGYLRGKLVCIDFSEENYI